MPENNGIKNPPKKKKALSKPHIKTSKKKKKKKITNPNQPKEARESPSQPCQPTPLFLISEANCFQTATMRPVLSEQARREVQAIPARDHEGWQTIFKDRARPDNHPASATQIEIPVDMDSVQTLEFIGFDGNMVGELYDCWCPEGEDSLLHHAKEYLARIYDQVQGLAELRCLLPAMGMSRAFNDEIWEMGDQIRRDNRFANTTIEKSNIKQWAAVEIGTRFKNLQNLNDRILGRRIETIYQASYDLTHKSRNSKDGAPDGFMKRNSLLEPTYHQFPQLSAGPRIWAFNPATMGNFRAAPMEDGRVKYVTQEPTGYTVPNSDGSQNVYVGRHQPPTGYGRIKYAAQEPTGYIVPNGDGTQNVYVGKHQPPTGDGGQYGRGEVPLFAQGHSLDESYQARLYIQEQSQAQRGGQCSAWDGPAPGMQQPVTGYVNPQGNAATPNLSGVSQNQFSIQDQLRAQLVGVHPAREGPAPNAQLRDLRGYAPIQLGPQACAPVRTNWCGNRMDVDAPPPYSAQPP